MGDDGEDAERAKKEAEHGAVASRPIPASVRTLLTGRSRSTRAIAARTSAVRLSARRRIFAWGCRERISAMRRA